MRLTTHAAPGCPGLSSRYRTVWNKLLLLFWRQLLWECLKDVSHCEDVIVFKRKPNALKWSVLRIWIMLEWKFKKCSCRAERTVKGLVLEREGIYSTLPTLIFYMNTLVCILSFFSFRYSKQRFKCFCNLSPNHRKGSNCDYCIIWKIPGK